MTDFPPPAPAPQRKMQLTGLHHVTILVRDLTVSTGFYRDVLGLTLVKQETNPDDPGAQHFWFGDGAGTPGTLISCLEYPDMDEGKVGRGSTHHLAFGVGSPEEQVAWKDWLRSRGVDCTEVFDRGGFKSIYFRDPDGHIIEVATR